MKVSVSLDKREYGAKPDKREIPGIKKRAACNWQDIEIAELAQLVGERGCSMIPAQMEGGLAAANCRAEQLFVLDFDDGISFAETEARCGLSGLPITFAYHTFSSDCECERFRVVFALDCLVEEEFSRNVVMGMLHAIFPECDHNCRDYARLFFGGKGLLCVHPEACVCMEQIMAAFYSRAGEHGNFKRQIIIFCNKNRIFIYNEMPLIIKKCMLHEYGEIMDSVRIHIIGESTKTPICIAECNKNMQQSLTCKVPQRRVALQGETNCQLLNDFLGGGDVDHAAKFAIATNLRGLRGGAKKFLETIRTYDTESFDKWKKDMKYMRVYKPQSCSRDFCPYYDECNQAGNMIETLAMDRKVICRNKDSLVSIDQAADCLRQNLEEAFLSRLKGIHLIKAQTALGKTSVYMDLIVKYRTHKFIVALPTNRLKEQVAKDLCCRLPEQEVFMTLSVENSNLVPPEIKAAISDYHKSGIHNMTRKKLKAYYDEIKDDPSKRAVAEECKKLMDGLRAMKDERVIVTTHAYLLQISPGFLDGYTVIIDEDILQLQFFNRCYEASVSSIKEVMEKGPGAYAGIAQKVIQAQPDVFTRTVPVGNIWRNGEDMEDMGGIRDENLYDLVYADTFVKKVDDETGDVRVHYYCAGRLEPVKYIILSATLNRGLYEKYFSGDMDVFMYPETKAAYKGKLHQYTYHSLGRKDLAGKMQVFQYACDLADNENLNIITFKKFQNSFAKGNILPLHFGNATGINAYKGQDLAIIGTPFNIDVSYKLVACHLGADVNRPEDKRPRVRRVEYNGYSFLLVTYADELLREVQMYSLESELEQCVGRARLLRENCTVYVFSSFPCAQAEIHMENYLL